MKIIDKIKNMEEKHFNKEYVMYNEKSNSLYITDKYQDKTKEIPDFLNSNLADLYDETNENGDDCNAFQSDAEEYLKKEGYSIRNLDDNWYKVFYGIR